MAWCDLDQLLAYLLLARWQRRFDPGFPAIERLGFYFCRHGHLWIAGTEAWTKQPGFPEIEEWFAKTCYQDIEKILDSKEAREVIARAEQIRRLAKVKEHYISSRK